MNQMN